MRREKFGEMKQNRGCERNGDRMKGSRARIVYMTYMYTWSPVYVYILDTYATLLVTRGSPIGLNKLSLFGTKIMTLFGHWEKRLLCGKCLSGFFPETNRTVRSELVFVESMEGLSFVLCFPYLLFPPLLSKTENINMCES